MPKKNCYYCDTVGDSLNCPFCWEENKNINGNKKNLCQEDSCYEKLSPSSAWGLYCSDHENACDNCSKRIANFYKYCSNNCAPCCHHCGRKLLKISDGLILNDGKNYCYEHTKFCYSCSTRINLSESYCSQHQKSCAICSGRTTADATYCYAHGKVCASCKTRISFDNAYCSNHLNTCSICSARTSSSQSYCSWHESQKNNQASQGQATKAQEQSQQKNHLKSLVQQKTALTSPQEVTTFTTWWNNNLATVVNHNSGYWVFLIVYDKEKTNNSNQINWNKEVFVFPTYQSATKWGEHSRQQHSSLSGAQSEASWLRVVLNNDNPILYIHPEVNNYCSFSEIIKEPYVIKRDIPHEIKTSFVPMSYSRNTRFYKPAEVTSKIPNENPDNYLKPLDIVKSNMGDFYHAGVYLGKIDGEYKVCDFSKKVNGTRIYSWGRFVEGNSGGEVFGYHPIIPFKNHSKITQQIVWAKSVEYRENNYDLTNRNCEHLANMLVYGINYSEQINNNKDLIINAHRTKRFTLGGLVFLGLGSDPAINNNKGSTIKLINEINETNNKLNQKSNDLSREIEARVEIPSKQNCQIM